MRKSNKYKHLSPSTNWVQSFGLDSWTPPVILSWWRNLRIQRGASAEVHSYSYSDTWTAGVLMGTGWWWWRPQPLRDGHSERCRWIPVTVDAEVVFISKCNRVWIVNRRAVLPEQCGRFRRCPVKSAVYSNRAAQTRVHSLVMVRNVPGVKKNKKLLDNGCDWNPVFSGISDSLPCGFGQKKWL